MNPFYSRREMLAKVGAGTGMIGLSTLIGSQATAAPADSGPLAPKHPIFSPKLKD